MIVVWQYEILGFVSGTLGLSIALPQLLRVMRRGTHEGVATLTWVVSLANFSTWIAYGFRYGSLSQTVTNILASAFTVALVFILIRQSRGTVQAAGVAVGTVAGFTLFGYFTPSWLMTAALFLLVTVSQIPQMRESRRSYLRREPTVVSRTTYVLLFTSSVGWITYGALTGLWQNIVASSIVLLASIFILYYETRHRPVPEQVDPTPTPL